MIYVCRRRAPSNPESPIGNQNDGEPIQAPPPTVQSGYLPSR